MFVDKRVEETQPIYIESSYGVIGVETTQPSQRYSIRPTITHSLTLSWLMIYPSIRLLIICLSIILVVLVVLLIKHRSNRFVSDGS